MPKTSIPPTNVVRLNAFDPDNVTQRLYKQVSALLGQLEEKDSKAKVTMRERVQALVAIGRLQELFGKMRKASGDVGAGAAVRKYESAFAPHAISGGKSDSGPAGEPEPDDWFEHAERDDGSEPDDDDDDDFDAS